MVMGKLGCAWHRCMGDAWRGDGWDLGFGVSINDVVYYLDGGVVGMVRLDLSIGAWFWMRYHLY